MKQNLRLISNNDRCNTNKGVFLPSLSLISFDHLVTFSVSFRFFNCRLFHLYYFPFLVSFASFFLIYVSFDSCLYGDISMTAVLFHFSIASNIPWLSKGYYSFETFFMIPNDKHVERLVVSGTLIFFSIL